MSDPRSDNAKAYHLASNGKVDGVQLVYVPNPSTQYELVHADLINEAEAAGGTVATFQVLDKNNVQTGERVFLAWPFPSLANHQLPGNQNNQHMIVNGYDAAGGVIGPLALYVGDTNGNVISDVIGGLGLPNNRHVCFRVVWKERGTSTTTPTTPTTDPVTTTDLTATNALLQQILVALKIIGAHLGVIFSE
jgi:hypothetical protein